MQTGDTNPPLPPVAGEAVDVAVRTFNSARTLGACLAAARRFVPIHHLWVIDRNSTDATCAVAESFGAEICREDTGIGRATRLALELADTATLLFLDSDVTLVRPDFYATAARRLSEPGVGAVVGNALHHPFAYGLPLGLTLIPVAWGRTVTLPAEAQGSETYYFRRALARDRRKVVYVPDAMIHSTPYRGRTWPEWQGAQIRSAAGWSPRELAFSLLVPLLIHANSRSARNLFYTPIFDLKLLRGFLQPDRWRRRDRRALTGDTLSN
jgi:glycosyltransferase involved in cell wall biosynthesis